MLCPYCYGPISRVRELGKKHRPDKETAFYRCLSCGADFVAEPETAPSNELGPAHLWTPKLQLVWPRAAG